MVMLIIAMSIGTSTNIAMNTDITIAMETVITIIISIGIIIITITDIIITTPTEAVITIIIVHGEKHPIGSEKILLNPMIISVLVLAKELGDERRQEGEDDKQE
jgi:hypothetical protein